MATNDPAILADGLAKAYDGRPALKGVSFSVARGEVFALLGPNGAGKTTAVEILEGFRTRDSGQALVLGSDPQTRTQAFRTRIGVVLQETMFEPEFTVAETLRAFAHLYPAARAPDALAALTGLTDSVRKRVGALSGGQRRRLDIAVALAGAPEVLFLDEPTTGLDPAARRGVWALIERLKAEGATILLTSHHMEEVEKLADNIGILAAGEMRAMGSPGALRRAHGGATRISFAAAPGAAWLEGVAGLVPTGEEAAGRLLFTAAEPARAVAALLEAAAREGVALDDLAVAPSTLEDVYLELVGPRAEAA